MKKRKSLISRITSVLISGTVAVLSVPVNAHVHTHAHAEDNSGELKHIRIVEGDSSEYGEMEIRYIDENGNEIVPNLKPERDDGAVSYPSSYDLRDYGYLTSVKQQYPTETCWAHSVMAVAESNMIVKGLADSSIDLSEAHLVWFARGRYSTDKSDPLYMDGENLGIDAYDKGGYPLLAQGTLARWSGVQLEANAPNVTTSPELSESQRYISYGYLVNSNNYDYDITDTTDIKNHLMNNGALTLSYYTPVYVENSSSDCYSDTYDSYYQTAVTERTNHAVTLVGWDDNFSKNKFEGAMPAGNGAWICKNSWGESFLDGGYFYMSYYEPTIARITSYEIDSADTYDSLYQYDGARDGGYSSIIGITGANIYTAEQTETIKSVGIYTGEASVPYIVSIYADVQDGNPMSGTLLTTQKGEVTYAGYHAIDLLNDVTVEKGTNFSVVVSLDKADAVLYCDPCIDKSGISYLTAGIGKSTSSWSDYSVNGETCCIKAYTLNGIEINSENFPDAVFRNYVKNTWDSDGNGYLSDTEAAAAKTINVSGMGISDFTGIEHFTSVTTLNCSSNPVISLDLSANTAMTKLVTTNCSKSYGEVPCYGFTVTGLDISKMSSVSGATIKNNAVYPTNTTITYSYDCGNGLTGNFSIKLSNITHTLDSWTYSTTSAHIRECKYCTYSESGTHSFGAWRDNGTNHIHTCSICSGSVTADHSYSSWNENSDGTHSRSCSVCGNVDITSHSFGEWSNNDDGTHSRSCVGCGYTESDSHSLSEWADNSTNHIRYCELCDFSETKSHSYSNWTKTNNSQHAKVCTSCGNTVTANHDFTDWTDNADGKHTRKCNGCGYTETLSHNYGAWSDNKDGNHKRTCSDCGNVETVAHVWGDWTDNDTNHVRECEVCHATESANHTYGDWTKTDEKYHAKKCDDCGNVISEEHHYGEWSDNGNAQQVRSCTDCGFKQIEDVPYTPGDLNRDGIINIFDVVLARHGFINGFADSTAEAATDVDCDGRLLIADMVKLQSFVAGKIDSFVS